MQFENSFLFFSLVIFIVLEVGGTFAASCCVSLYEMLRFFFAIVILADTCCLPFDTVRIIIWPWRIMRSGRLVWSHTRHRARGGKWKSINISIEMRLLDSLLQESHSATGERIERMEKMKKKISVRRCRTCAIRLILIYLLCVIFQMETFLFIALIWLQMMVVVARCSLVCQKNKWEWLNPTNRTHCGIIAPSTH